jgi:hypothetical protein
MEIKYRSKEEVEALINLYKKLELYKLMKSQITIDAFSREAYIPTFPNYNNGRISLGNENDKNFNHITKGLTSQILNNTAICDKTKRLYPYRKSENELYVSNGSELVALILCNSIGDEQYFKTKRLLKKAHFKGTRYAYDKMPFSMLEQEAKWIADATDISLYG